MVPVREDQAFDYVCRSCYNEYSHVPREGLEETLVEVGAGTVDDATFLERYVQRLEGY